MSLEKIARKFALPLMFAGSLLTTNPVYAGGPVPGTQVDCPQGQTCNEDSPTQGGSTEQRPACGNATGMTAYVASDADRLNGSLPEDNDYSTWKCGDKPAGDNALYVTGLCSGDGDNVCRPNVAPVVDPVAPVVDPVAPAVDPVAPVVDPVAPVAPVSTVKYVKQPLELSLGGFVNNFDGGVDLGLAYVFNNNMVLGGNLGYSRLHDSRNFSLTDNQSVQTDTASGVGYLSEDDSFSADFGYDSNAFNFGLMFGYDINFDTGNDANNFRLRPAFNLGFAYSGLETVTEDRTETKSFYVNQELVDSDSVVHDTVSSDRGVWAIDPRLDLTAIFDVGSKFSVFAGGSVGYNHFLTSPLSTSPEYNLNNTRDLGSGFYGGGHVGVIYRFGGSSPVAPVAPVVDPAAPVAPAQDSNPVAPVDTGAQLQSLQGQETPIVTPGNGE